MRHLNLVIADDTDILSVGNDRRARKVKLLHTRTSPNLCYHLTDRSSGYNPIVSRQSHHKIRTQLEILTHNLGSTRGYVITYVRNYFIPFK